MDIIEMERKYFLNRNDPEYAEMSKRLKDIEKEMQEIKKKMSEKERRIQVRIHY